MTHKTQPTAHAEITTPISADLRRIDDAGTKSAPITLMTEDRACKWAWDQVQQDVGTKGWTAGDSCTFYGFFLWGWNYRGQYETQRSAAPPAPAAAAVPGLSLTDEQIEQAFISARDQFMLREVERTDKKLRLAFGRAVLHSARAALAAAPAQAVAVPPLTPDEARKAAQFARLMNGPSDTTQPSEYAMAGALALAAKLATPAQAPEQWIDDPHDIEQGRMLNPEWVRAQEHATQLAGQALPADEFRGDTASLVRNIVALLDLDAQGCLVPHGVGGHARGLLSAAASRLAAPAQAQEDARDAARYRYWKHWWIHEDSETAQLPKTVEQMLEDLDIDAAFDAAIDAARAAQGGAA